MGLPKAESRSRSSSSTSASRSGRCSSSPSSFSSSAPSGRSRSAGPAGSSPCRATPWVARRVLDDPADRDPAGGHAMSRTRGLSPEGLLALLVLALAMSPARAHIQAGEAGGFVSGFRHPISGLDHILAMVSVGLWGAQLGAPAIWLLPVAPDGHGVRRVPRPRGRSAARRRSRSRCGRPPRPRGRARGAPAPPARPRSSASSRSSTDTRTARSCRPDRAGSSTASASWSRPASFTSRALPSASSTAGRGDASRFVLRAHW